VNSYRVALTSSAEKELNGLPKKVIARIVPRLEHLASVPRPPGCKKLKGGDHEWRIRVGDYRIVYVIDDTARLVDVTRIAHRREVYE
jgi:mRNA interferase RelE/StbE